MSAIAILLVLLATTGIHIHADHDDHDDHHVCADYDHADDVDHDAIPGGGDPSGGDPSGGEDDTDGHDGILIHSHSVLVDLMSPQVVLTVVFDHYATSAKYHTFCDIVPDHPVRDIDPPPNKRVL